MPRFHKNLSPPSLGCHIPLITAKRHKIELLVLLSNSVKAGDESKRRRNAPLLSVRLQVPAPAPSPISAAESKICEERKERVTRYPNHICVNQSRARAVKSPPPQEPTLTQPPFDKRNAQTLTVRLSTRTLEILSETPEQARRPTTALARRLSAFLLCLLQFESVRSGRGDCPQWKCAHIW